MLPNWFFFFLTALIVKHFKPCQLANWDEFWSGVRWNPTTLKEIPGYFLVSWKFREIPGNFLVSWIKRIKTGKKSKKKLEHFGKPQNPGNFPAFPGHFPEISRFPGFWFSPKKIKGHLISPKKMWRSPNFWDGCLNIPKFSSYGIPGPPHRTDAGRNSIQAPIKLDDVDLLAPHGIQHLLQVCRFRPWAVLHSGPQWFGGKSERFQRGIYEDGWEFIMMGICLDGCSNPLLNPSWAYLVIHNPHFRWGYSMGGGSEIIALQSHIPSYLTGWEFKWFHIIPQ